MLKDKNDEQDLFLLKHPHFRIWISITSILTSKINNQSVRVVTLLDFSVFRSLPFIHFKDAPLIMCIKICEEHHFL